MNKILSVSVVNSILRTSYKTVATNSCKTFHNNCIRVVNSNVNINSFACKAIKYSTDQSNIATYEEIKEIASNKNKKVLLIDVREPEELRETGVLPGSINIPLGDVESALKDLSNEEFLRKYGLDKPTFDKPIIFSCKLGKRSAQAQAVSQQLGYKHVKNYLGGWLDWEERSQNK